MKTSLFLLSLLAPTLAFGHHGQDFFVNLDARVPEFGHFFAFTGASYTEDAYGQDELTVEPGFLVGTGGGTSFGLTAEFLDEGSGFDYDSISPVFQWSRAIDDNGIRLGVALSYIFANGETHSDEDGHSHGPARQQSVSPVLAQSFGSNPDAPIGPIGGGHDHNDDEQHDYSGIHRHAEDFFSARLILEWQATEETRFVANFILVSGWSDDFSYGYTLGARHELTSQLGIGVEAIGEFSPEGEHQAIGGFYYSMTDDLNFRLGAGTGIGPHSPRLSVYTGATYRF